MLVAGPPSPGGGGDQAAYESRKVITGALEVKITCGYLCRAERHGTDILPIKTFMKIDDIHISIVMRHVTHQTHPSSSTPTHTYTTTLPTTAPCTPVYTWTPSHLYRAVHNTTPTQHTPAAPQTPPTGTATATPPLTFIPGEGDIKAICLRYDRME